ncbi:uncharacterized protein LOC143803640 [Ranitomeya variabilis]|uniref:uncharacterized protein LOC143803640 n=1 Tax=Ranitomeya variabilis TaxID=490064 RepID=UPI0040571B60
MSGPIAKVTINVQGKPLPFLVDTGAARSVIRLQDLPFPDLISSEAVTCVGVDGKPTSNKLTRKIQVGPYEDMFMRLVVSPTCPTNLLGADLLQKLRATIAYSSDGLTITITDPLDPSEECQLQAAPLLMMMDEAAKTVSSVPPEVMSQVPSTLWSTGPEDIGRLAVPPVRVILKPGAQLPRVPQYPLKSVQEESLATQIKTLLENGALVKYASKLMQPLYDDLKTSEFPLCPKSVEAFYALKQAIQSAPALGIPNYQLPFYLFVSEVAGHASGVLAQKHGGRTRPIGYYSARLDSVSQASPTCLRAVHAVHMLLDKTSDIILGHPVLLMAPHDIKAILGQTQPKHLSLQRHMRLQCSLLIPDNVTLVRCTILNPSTLLPLSRGDVDDDTDALGEDASTHSEDHDCLEQMQEEAASKKNVSEDPLPHADLTFFTDGSRFADETGRFHTGYAVVTHDQVISAGSLPPHMSAQEAELKALTLACQEATEKVVNIYTDSRYAFGVAHDFGSIWAARGYLTSSGTPVKHAAIIQELVAALDLPLEVAVIKIKAHGRLDSPEARGNFFADKTAKTYAVHPFGKEKAAV